MHVIKSVSRPISSIRIDDQTFASLIFLQENGDADIELNFSVSQLYAIKVDAYAVRVTVRSNRTSTSISTLPSERHMLSRGLIDAAVKQGQLSKSAALNNLRDIVDLKTIDVLASMNKSSLSRLRTYSDMNDKELLRDALTDAPFATSVQSLRSVADAKSAGVRLPVLHRYLVNNDEHDSLILGAKSMLGAAANSGMSPDRNRMLLKPTMLTKSYMRYATLLQSVSPSMMSDTLTHAMAARDALSGVTRHSSPRVSRLGELIDSMTLPIAPVETSIDVLATDDKVITLGKTFNEYVPVRTKITLPNPWDVTSMNANGTLTSYYVTIELVKSDDNKVVESVDRTIDLGKLVDFYCIPKEKPSVLTSVVLGSRSHLDIQSSEQAMLDTVIYRKVLSRVAPVTLDTKFEILGTRRKMLNRTKRVTNVEPGENLHIYRVVPIGAFNAVSPTFSDQVVTRDSRFYNKFVSVVVVPSKMGTTIELRGFSHDVAAVQVIRRDMTLIENSYTRIGDIQIVAPDNRNRNPIFVYDYDLKPGHVYEYSTILTLRRGTTQQFGSSVIEYLAYVDGVDTHVSDVMISAGQNPDVSFNILTRIAKSNMDDVVAMLEAQNLKTYFSDDILNEKEKLESLIAHNVVRVNLTEGIREDFGVITDSLFVDSVHRKRNSVSDIDVHNEYRYEISALLRTPETMIEELVRTKKDLITKKEYSFKPSKFFHPITLSRGNISTPATINARYGRKPMMFGRVGNLEVVNVTFSRDVLTLTNAIATRRSIDDVYITWTVDGELNTIDHFVIMSVCNGVKRIVGTSHPHFDTQECKFNHRLTPADYGYVHYAIVPVLNDYTQMAEISTNDLVIQ